jgi:hypothetical protein
MEKVSVKYNSGKTIIYDRIPSGTCFHEETPGEVRYILERARDEGHRLRLFYGDTETGRDWLEELDIMGTIGRSTGTIKIPILIRNRRSTGGPAILDHCIVKITRQHRVLYQHPKYNHGELAVQKDKRAGRMYPWDVTRDNIVVASFDSEGKARRFKSFIQGNRNSYAGTARVPNLTRSRD